MREKLIKLDDVNERQKVAKFELEHNTDKLNKLDAELSDLKDKQKSLNKNFDFIDSLIIRACDAPQVQGKSRLKYEAR